jgi:hypothetical protein
LWTVGLLLAGCQRGEAPVRDLRAHTFVVQGVAHAQPAVKGARYCSHCHGATLAGGAAGQPSCYQCHGKNWLDTPEDPPGAPADHTVLNETFRHHPDLLTPGATCTACHGASLEGVANDGLTYPGCELCHERLWESR